MKILLICGGPSKEHNISLNSARSIYDNISKVNGIFTEVLFINADMSKYLISERELYSNTASDFRYLLSGREGLDNYGLEKKLKSVDLVFPLIHGKFGEDGTLQGILEMTGVPFVSSNSKACRLMYNKKSADENILKRYGFFSVPKLFLFECDIEKALHATQCFFKRYDLNEVVVKPVEGGSSIGVSLCKSAEEAAEKAVEGCHEYGEMVIEKRCEGKEFTVIILENGNKSIALVPSEIENTGIFDTRKKYLATGETTYYCPPRFEESIIKNIREQAQKLFSVINANDFLRIDGWVMNDGNIYFSDFNPVSGTEQNSFIFQQATRVGFTHTSLLLYIINNALKRFGINLLPYSYDDIGSKSTVNVLLGGATSERNVSLMSGGNVWLKLLSSKVYNPVPYLVSMKGDEYFLQKVPYHVMLNHTVEEMQLQLEQNSLSEYYKNAFLEIIDSLDAERYIREDAFKTETAESLKKFLIRCAEKDEYVFIGLHGGFGENGDLQKMLEQYNISFNGAGSKAARLCMDKYKTGIFINDIKLKNVRSCKKRLINVDEFICDDYIKIWNELQQDFKCKRIVAKPNDDGCSTGVVVLTYEGDLKRYFECCLNNQPIIPNGTFFGQEEIIQFTPGMKRILLEEYISTDSPLFIDDKIIYSADTGWIELTVGVTENNGMYCSFLPSIAVAESGNKILTLEEKFQGGMGINITPPPSNIINDNFIKRIQSVLEKIAEEFNIKDYCRIDIFVNNKTEEIIIIEINTLPGLSPSTVLFQQAAKENLSPQNLIEKFIKINRLPPL